ncbi:MAG TPA: nucleotidyltransferase domain-containing protein [Vicinamibacterales bacterium]|nr:nucleotidyltransferase domain-containing protein [Vicinamibacterales bacterium]
MTLAPATRAAVEEFSRRVRARFGDRVAKLALFGSHARGEATEESDVDILVVIDDLTPSDGREIDEIVGDILTRMDVVLSPLALSAARLAELRARERRIAREIDRDGIPV